MRVRWPFLAALVATVVGTGAMAATPHVKAAWEERREAQLEREAAAEFKRAQPAADALEAMPRPAGLRNCDDEPDGSIALLHFLCWRGDGEVEPATVAVAAELRRIGADQVSPSCLRKSSGHPGIRVRCEVTAMLHGQVVSIDLHPHVERVGTSFRAQGVYASGDIGLWEVEDLPILGSATPLPIPGD